MNERKTLDDRQKMTDFERIRHSAAHVLATAILRIWPEDFARVGRIADEKLSFL